ncbi:hypothetical protein B2D07_13020 [Desulfococcus multivorans]|nr:hypothetical protein B2D07_13020 [Desulfococcus multivorans]
MDHNTVICFGCFVRHVHRDLRREWFVIVVSVYPNGITVTFFRKSKKNVEMCCGGRFETRRFRSVFAFSAAASEQRLFQAVQSQRFNSIQSFCSFLEYNFPRKIAVLKFGRHSRTSSLKYNIVNSRPPLPTCFHLLEHRKMDVRAVSLSIVSVERRAQDQ